MPPNEKRRYVMTSDLRQYIAEYTIANIWRYPIRRRVTYASALECKIYRPANFWRYPIRRRVTYASALEFIFIFPQLVLSYYLACYEDLIHVVICPPFLQGTQLLKFPFCTPNPFWKWVKGTQLLCSLTHFFFFFFAHQIHSENGLPSKAWWSKFFPQEYTPFQKGAQNQFVRIASHESVLIPIKCLIPHTVSYFWDKCTNALYWQLFLRQIYQCLILSLILETSAPMPHTVSYFWDKCTNALYWQLFLRQVYQCLILSVIF